MKMTPALMFLVGFAACMMTLCTVAAEEKYCVLISSKKLYSSNSWWCDVSAEVRAHCPNACAKVIEEQAHPDFGYYSGFKRGLKRGVDDHNYAVEMFG